MYKRRGWRRSRPRASPRSNRWGVSFEAVSRGQARVPCRERGRVAHLGAGGASQQRQAVCGRRAAVPAARQAAACDVLRDAPEARQQHDAGRKGRQAGGRRVDDRTSRRADSDRSRDRVRLQLDGDRLRPAGRDHRLGQRPDDRLGSEHIRLRIRPGRVHDRQRLFERPQPAGRNVAAAKRSGRGGRDRARR